MWLIFFIHFCMGLTYMKLYLKYIYSSDEVRQYARDHTKDHAVEAWG